MAELGKVGNGKTGKVTDNKEVELKSPLKKQIEVERPLSSGSEVVTPAADPNALELGEIAFTLNEVDHPDHFLVGYESLELKDKKGAMSGPEWIAAEGVHRNDELSILRYCLQHSLPHRLVDRLQHDLIPAVNQLERCLNSGADIPFRIYNYSGLGNRDGILTGRIKDLGVYSMSIEADELPTDYVVNKLALGFRRLGLEVYSDFAAEVFLVKTTGGSDQNFGLQRITVAEFNRAKDHVQFLDNSYPTNSRRFSTQSTGFVISDRSGKLFYETEAEADRPLIKIP